MTQPTEQQGNQPESSEQPVYQPAPAWAPQFSAAAPAIPNGSSTTSGIATANGHATVCAIAYVGPGTSGLPVSTVTAGPGLCFSLPLPESGNGPAEPTISRARAIRAFVGTADRITGYRDMRHHSCRRNTPRSCMDQPATVCPGGSYRRPVRSGRADCGCAFAASTPYAA